MWIRRRREMDARFLARALGLTIGASSLLSAVACSQDESLGRDENAASRGMAGGAGTSSTDPNCDTIECFRALECVEYCGGPIVQSSCCPCPSGLLDELVDCPSGGGGTTGSGGTTSSGGFSGDPNVPRGGEGGYATGGAPGGEAGAPGSVEPDLNQLHVSCVDGACPDGSGLTALEYYGFDGSTLFCSCEIPCDMSADNCPATTVCVTISDGPGEVCDRAQ
jgi:hypothetical protein